MTDMIKNSDFYRKEPRVKKWLDDNNVGTVHTFQGQGTDEVIFLLGCDKNATGAANWVNRNIVNVAVTRAKFRIYLVGDRTVWTCKPVKVARERTGNVTGADKLDNILSASCPRCGKMLVERNGKNGKFWGCSGFPACRYTKSF